VLMKRILGVKNGHERYLISQGELQREGAPRCISRTVEEVERKKVKR